VRLNDRELLQLRQRARARGLSVTRLLVDAALAQPAEPADPRTATPAADEPGERSETFEGIEQRRARGQDRSLRLSVRLNRGERDELVKRARARGLSVTRLLVDGALELPLPQAHASVTARDRALIDGLVRELDEVRAELGRVGNNLNQMAHGANISRELPAARRLEEALAEHRALTSQLMRVSVRLARWSRGLPGLPGWAPEGEDEDDEGSEEWWARRVESHRAYTDEVPREAYE
jgi:post-segregation antitoxin (ccd killing protein)